MSPFCRRSRLLPLATLLAGLAAPPLAAAMDAPPSCPPTPIRVDRSIGAPTSYLGAFAGVPDLCLIGQGADRGYYYLGIWKSDWPGAGDAYPAMQAATAGPPGTRTSFVTRSYPGMQWTDSFVNEGIEPITVGGRSYRALRFAHERAGIEGNTYHSIITSWRDLRTGIRLKVVESQISGQSYGPATTWTAVRVEPIE